MRDSGEAALSLEVAALVPGTETPVSEGATGALRCVIELPDGQRRAAILKRAPVGQVAAEAFAALLLREWGLPVPDPFLIREVGGLAFACADAGYPSLRQRITLDTLPPGAMQDAALRVAIGIAMQLRTSPLAAAADEAIDNRDRNLGNVLWDGSAEVWIDHAFAFGQYPAGYQDVNKLCSMAVMSGNHEPFKTSAVGQALAMSQSSHTIVASAMPAELPTEGFAQLVAARVVALASRVLARFPAPPDLLSEL